MLPGGTPQFLCPDGNYRYLCGSVVFDSWIQWADILPEDQKLYSFLTLEIFSNIQALAREIQILHKGLDRYKKEEESPWSVQQHPMRQFRPRWKNGRQLPVFYTSK